MLIIPVGVFLWVFVCVLLFFCLFVVGVLGFFVVVSFGGSYYLISYLCYIAITLCYIAITLYFKNSVKTFQFYFLIKCFESYHLLKF